MLNQPLDIIFPDSQKCKLAQNLDLENLPKHVSIIMDGNGRWAKKQGKRRLQGHKAGVKSVKEIVRCSSDLGIKYLSIYSFSTENWTRPKEEVIGLMDLFAKSVISEMDELNENNVRIKFLGDISILPKRTLKAFEVAAKKMENNTGLVLMPAVNYGSRAEILRAVNKICKENIEEEITEEDFSNYLYTKDVPDPELLIRTSGEMRISNYLLWQIAYSEFYVTSVLWPDFDRYEFLDALLSYQNRNRRFGGV